jgi:hypothetical protein
VEEIEEEQRKRRSQCPSGDFHYLSSFRPQDRGDHSDTTGKRNHAGTSFSSERALFPPQTNPDPSLRTNNGAPISQGVANGERGVAERVCTPPPSSEGKFVEEGTRGAKVERDMSVHSWIVPDRFHQGRESLSVKRNITKRESRQPKTRSSDQDYQRRYSMSPSTVKHSLGLQFPAHHLGEIADGVPSPRMEGTRSHRDSGGSGFSYTPPVVEDKGGYGRQPITETRGQLPGQDSYDIHLTFEGQLVRHQVTPAMMVVKLRDDAALIYRLISQDLILVLFGLNPQTLSLQSRLSGPPLVGPGATVMVFDVRGMAQHDHQAISPQRQPNYVMPAPVIPCGPKFLGNFKLTKFDGSSRSWKQWDKSFVRYLSIHQLDHVIEESFLDVLPLSPQDFNSNKMVYYLLEDSLIPGSLAAKYFRQAAKWNGSEAYMRLHDGYVFSGPQTMSILLAQLVNLRFKADESASGFCLRLREIFEDLEMVPGPSSILMNDTQKIGYLLSGIRQEKPLQSVYVALQDKQLRGAATFEEACEDLHNRCDAIRADELLDTPVRGQTKTLISTQAKRQNKPTLEIEMGPCLKKGCTELVKIYLPLCPTDYHQCVSGKTPEVELKDGLGVAKYNTTTQVIDYPSGVPKNRFPLPRSERPRKALAFL